EWLYKNTLEKFEDFCCDFINGAIDIIKQYNPTYYSSIILNDESFRKRIIKTGSAFHEKLTGREIDCLYWAAYGKSSEETANILKLSKLTIDGYRSSVKRKLNAANMAQAVFEAVRHGYLGAFDKAWKISDPISLNGISISESENKASTEEKIKNSLWLLNTELLSTHQH
ncbi:helix-turn-helix transcriptional regulator, partial [Candidatus Dependentiae bacterium]|nr:helix-turn-helix transcriptional regulator [Candidatus Dependentiae bacterium]